MYFCTVNVTKPPKKHIMKTRLFFLMAVLLGANAWGQDTLVQRELKGNYMHNRWFDDAERDTITHFGLGGLRVDVDMYLLGFEAKDSVSISGIAIAAWTEKELRQMNGRYDSVAQAYLSQIYFDTSDNSTIEYLRLYKMEAGVDSATQYGEDLPVHFGVDPVSYYIDHGFRYIVDTNYEVHSPVYGVYERFFQSPINLLDTFYVGVTTFKMGDNPFDTLGNHYHNYTWPLWIHNFMDDTLIFYPVVHYFDNPNDNPMTGRRWEKTLDPYIYYIFPIITDESNIPNGEGTAAIDEEGKDMIDRYVSLSPNPASKKVQVLSSFGMSQVEIFNANGNKVLSEKVSGLKAILDISTLPAGSYVACIKTPMGTVTKKLIVR